MSLRLGGVVRDTAVTMIGEALVLIGGLLLYALIARYFGPIGVGEAALVKRGSGLLQPIVFLGIQTGFPRSIAIVHTDVRRTGATIAAGLFVLATSTGLVSLLILAAQGPASSVLLGDSRYSFLIPALVMTLVSIIVYGGVRGVLFGMLRIPLANVIQIIAVAIAPVAIIAVVHPNVSTALVLAAAGTTVVSALALLPIVANPLRRIDVHAVRDEIVGLVRYSVPRMPGDVMMAALVSVGVLWAARAVDVRTAGYLSVSMSLLSAITAAFVPLSVVLLPRAASLIAAGRIDAIRSRVDELLRLTVLGSVFVAAQAIVFADTILRWWLGAAFAAGAPALRAVLAGVPFLALFFSLRGLIDAAAVRPYHTYNLGAALAVTLLGYGLTWLILPHALLTVGIALSGSVGFAVLAALTLWVLVRLYRVDVPAMSLAAVLGINVLGAAAAVALHTFDSGVTTAGLAVIAGFEVVAAAAILGPFFWGAASRYLRAGMTMEPAGLR